MAKARLASGLESELRNTVDWDTSGLLTSILQKFNCFCLTSPVTLVLLK